MSFREQILKTNVIFTMEAFDSQSHNFTSIGHSVITVYPNSYQK